MNLKSEYLLIIKARESAMNDREIWIAKIVLKKSIVFLLIS
jgi:hypothetical protein